MAKILQVVQRQDRCPLVVKNNIGDALYFLVTGNRHGWQHGRILNGCVDGNDALDPTLRQQLRVATQQDRVVPMNHRQEEIISLSQVLLNAADD